ncbi:hypothetical protein AKJ16_DCAP01182 [Drosera capensis]
MAMATKPWASFLCAALIIVLVAEHQASSEVLASEQDLKQQMSADRGATRDARRRRSRSRACSSARSVAQSACVCLQGHMGTSRCALAITTGRPREEPPSAHRDSIIN